MYFTSKIVKLLGDRVSNRTAYAAAYDCNLLQTFRVRGSAERAYEILDKVAFHLVVQLLRRGSNDLENNGNNTGLAVEVSDCQRDSLSIFVYAKNNKLTGFCLAGHMRGLDVQQSDCRVELSSSYNLVHVRHTFLCIFVLLPPGSNTYAGNLPAQCSSFIL